MCFYCSIYIQKACYLKCDKFKRMVYVGSQKKLNCIHFFCGIPQVFLKLFVSEKVHRNKIKCSLNNILFAGLKVYLFYFQVLT